jgi:hypothetical protein
MMSSLAETPEYQAARRFVDLTIEKRELRDRLNAIEEQLKALEPALVGYLAALGQREFVVANYLLYPHRQPWVYPAPGITRLQVCEALKISGLGRMVAENYSTESLTHYVKELEAHHQLTTGEKLTVGLHAGALERLLPAALAHLLNVKAAFQIRVKQNKEPFPYAYDAPQASQTEGDEEHA